MSYAPATAAWKVQAFARMAIAMRRVWSPGSWWRYSAIRRSGSGRSRRSFSSRSALRATAFSRMSVLAAIARSDTASISSRPARSSIPPPSEPVSGKRKTPGPSAGDAAPDRPSTAYSKAASSTRSASCHGGASRSDCGARSATAYSISSPVFPARFPSLPPASRSTVCAGANSVSTMTGAPVGLSTRMSGRALPSSASRSSAEACHTGLRRRRDSARAVFSVCSSLRVMRVADGFPGGDRMVRPESRRPGKSAAPPECRVNSIRHDPCARPRPRIPLAA